MARVRERLPRLSPVQRAGRATTSVGCALLFATAIFGAIPLVLLLRNGSAGTEHLVFPIGGLALALSIVAGGVLASRLPAPRFSRLRAHVHARRARAAEPPRNGPPRRARRVRDPRALYEAVIAATPELELAREAEEALGRLEGDWRRIPS